MDSKKLVGALRVQSKALEAIHSGFRKKGFIELMPIVLSTTTDPLGPDPGSSVIKTPSIEYFGQSLVLTQSMVLHKQILATRGIDKFYIVSPNVRLESAHRKKSGRHLFEFSQVDYEIAHGTMDDVFSLTEDILRHTIKHVIKECPDELATWGRELKVPGPFKKFTTTQLHDKYGKEWESLASKDLQDPFWTISHKREFYDAEDEDRPGFYKNYDLVYPEGYGEALSGAEREFKLERILMRIKRDGFSLKDYEPYLKYARAGFVPTAGAGFGVERLTRFLVGAKHVGDIQPFRRVPGELVVI
ncbi:MAG: asparagine synthetase [Candidatus Altiarchaeota archaeon]|nr:asparagine synthetase [Candidatus Altiarchaeota archaeon]